MYKKIIALALTAVLLTGCSNVEFVNSSSGVSETQTSSVTSSTASTSSETSVVEASSSSVVEEVDTKHRNQTVNGVSVAWFGAVRGDVTGNWYVCAIADSNPVDQYALDYYNAFFESDSEILGVWNATLNTMTKIAVVGGELNATTHEYVKGEEHDADLMYSGMVLTDNFYDMTTGELIPMDE